MSEPHATRLGVCYYPEHWPEAMWAQDAAAMAGLGLSRVRIGEFACSRIEPEPGRFAWEWLDRAIDTLHGEGLGIILGTPTATPPKWLVDTMPDMVALDREGRPRGFGSRRHYCFSHGGYREEAARIVEALARRYGEHPAIVGWQTDNEYGCHDTAQSFSPAARDAFRLWLAERYEDVAALNEAWGNVFWSMEYRSFDEVELPNLTVTEANPAHWLAFRRFTSDQVVAFDAAQVAIIRAHSPGREVMHNAMGFYTGYDHRDLAANLDLLVWDSYPLGFTEMFPFAQDDKRRFARTGHPDVAAFHHDLYRGCALGGRWGVIEQQPGPVNWARNNPAPLPGMVRLWTLEAAAHGAELVSYFRWRQAQRGQEQMHAGLLRPDSTPAPALAEVQAVAREMAELAHDPTKAPRHAALVFDYPSEWMTQIQPQGSGPLGGTSALWAAFHAYTALRRLGLNVDIVGSEDALEGYALAVLPAVMSVGQDLAEELARFEGQIVIGPRTGSRDREFAIADGLPPGPLRDLSGGRVTLSETIRADVHHRGDGWHIEQWLDHWDTIAEAELTAADGTVAAYRHGRVRIAAAWLRGDFALELIGRAARDAGLPHRDIGEARRRRTTARHVFAFDYDAGTVEIDEREDA